MNTIKLLAWSERSDMCLFQVCRGMASTYKVRLPLLRVWSKEERTKHPAIAAWFREYLRFDEWGAEQMIGRSVQWEGNVSW